MKVWSKSDNKTMLMDYYELTMSQAYFDQGLEDTIGYFDLYFRSVPEQGGYALLAGLEQMVEYLENLKFSEENLTYLKQVGNFTDEFIDYLRNFTFTCDIWAIPEGTPVFPNEPLIKVRGPLIQAQMIETMLLVTINHQTLIATKASRIARAANGAAVLEFGARRAQGSDASVLGARAAYIGGVEATSCTIAGEYFDIPIAGTMAHSFVLAFPSEYEAFRAYAFSYPDDAILLIDTYHTLQTGIQNAIAVAKDILEPMGKKLKGVRIDSGDLAYLSQECRKQLDQAGLTDCKIFISSALDEYIIRDLVLQDAKIDGYGVGERLITSRAEPVFGGVYKLSAIEGKEEIIPKVKVSDNPEKITNPCSKSVYRFYNKATGMAQADLITVTGETIDENEPYELFDPEFTWKRKTVTNFEAVALHKQIYKSGKLVYDLPSIQDIRKHAIKEQDRLWKTLKRFENPHKYYVDLSQELWDVKDKLIRKLITKREDVQ